VNAPLRRTAIAAIGLFAALFINVNYVQFVQADSLRDNRNNRRVQLDRYARERGEILAGDKRIVTNVETKSRYRFQRDYLSGPLYAHITGYNSLYYGRTGIEDAYDDVLAGEDESLFASRLSDFITGREPQGAAVRLTIRDSVQRAAAEQLGDRRGAVVAIDPKTGAILAMVSMPTYDPQPISSLDQRKAAAGFDKAKDTPGNALVSKATADTAPPGSIFKVITAAAYLDKQGKKPSDRIASPHRLDLPLTTNVLRNFGDSTCGGDNVTLEKALEVSCNTAFANMGLAVGPEALREQAEKFGFNEPFDDFPLRTVRSVFPSGIDEPQTAYAAIGQHDVRVTPLQMAMVAGAIGNSGVVMKPRVVDAVIGEDLQPIRGTSPEVDRLKEQPAVTPAVAGMLTQMMETAVRSGSGQKAQIQGIRVAGKTGTAQNAEGKPPHAWFIGFAPADNPSVAICVFVEGGDAGGSTEATGGRVAAPIAKAVMEAALKR
jgi:peptidoglycan glycosyltransferase